MFPKRYLLVLPYLWNWKREFIQGGASIRCHGWVSNISGTAASIFPWNYRVTLRLLQADRWPQTLISTLLCIVKCPTTRLITTKEIQLKPESWHFRNHISQLGSFTKNRFLSVLLASDDGYNNKPLLFKGSFLLLLPEWGMSNNTANKQKKMMKKIQPSSPHHYADKSIGQVFVPTAVPWSSWSPYSRWDRGASQAQQHGKGFSWCSWNLLPMEHAIISLLCSHCQPSRFSGPTWKAVNIY